MLPDGRGGREPVSAYSRIERFYLSAHADRGGMLGMIARYAPGKVLLTHGDVAPRTNMAGYLNGKYEVALPKAGEVIELQDSRRRKGVFLNAGKKKLEALKERHSKGKVQVRYDAGQHAVIIELPEEMDGALFGEGEYTLEVLRGKLSRLSRVKLRERDQEALAGMESPEADVSSD
ncbi:MBL fold metallo-hydrolase RNA specificity domain-containing protein [Deinococcus marmoris]|uniref:Zn-dependent metallo-hydrolase RNA specificity domain-containing protein n=1 Tax=Deinococcus marmoris TaxID=249408 RepID=A0A1U7NUZ5_9DEIO|nr:MBL fold metallo-hydrolase RNA specificity domain-containing protein [Deinococcus marmoris]OLV16736.1 hypothetical protein BOO71_0010954 [Deinococcus marmoris]